MTANTSAEVDRKVERVARLARDAGLRGVLLSTQWNFAWLTGGRSNRIDISRDTGSGSLLVTADGRRFVLANTIETPRMMSETLDDAFGFESIEYRWTDERADPTLLTRRAVDAAGGGPIGADIPSAHAQPFEARLMRERLRLDEGELSRYRGLGADVGGALGDVMREMRPGFSENDVARRVATTLIGYGAQPVVLLVAADDRIDKYRHPTPTNRPWADRLMVAVCAERQGLVVALSRLVCAPPPQEAFVTRTRATQDVFAALLAATKPGATGAQLFDAASAAYARAGFRGEEQKHHQGGAIAYRSREWVAHPLSQEIVVAPQALAWNPTITGTKVEETCLLLPDGTLEVVTSTPGWPSRIVDAGGQRVTLPDAAEV